MKKLALISFAIFLVACKPLSFEDGWAAIKVKDKPKAIKIFTPLAGKGVVRVQTELGIIYESEGFKAPQKAFKYYKLAAN
ncbi:hypothetical protein [Pseudomonas oryzihabitans]|uniref:hypothetical protein n=1 Tax=Pseudomonas oryzihabitans TaxID=47885 RepID=UPI0012E3C21F|nr:hypothetical protein [Pseudomonas oryzihabitans]